MAMLPWKSNRRILLGITAGIAAYKAPDIVRALRRCDCDVKVVLTEEAKRFISPLVLSTLSGHRVLTDDDFLSEENGWKIPHITLSEWAEAIIVAPCSAESLSRIVVGGAKNLLDATLLAARVPVILFPAMNVNMWSHPATCANVSRARELGYSIVEPDSGYLACGYEGKGRLPDKEIILEELWRNIAPKKDLKGKKILVTAGPTWEFMDPVRYIGNPSTGKMGFALARTAWYRGGDVRLVAGPTGEMPPYDVPLTRVVSARDMLDAVLDQLADADVIVKAAAVGDYRSDNVAGQKIKREGKDTLKINLVQNPDIAAEVGGRKRPGQLLVGFAAETENIVTNAMGKLKRKNMDIIVANDLTASDAGFGVNTNKVRVFSSSGGDKPLSGTKEYVADRIWDLISDKINVQ